MADDFYTKEKGLPKSTFEKALPSILLALIVAIIAILGLGLISAFSQRSPETVTNVDIALSLKPVGQLVTTETKLAKIGVKIDMQIGNCKFGADYLTNGTIETGIDVANFSEANVSYDERLQQYQVTVPYPQLTRCAFDVFRYAERSSFCAGLDYARDLDRISSYSTTKGIIEDSLTGGILDRSKREATVLIESIVKALTGKTAKVTFEEPSDNVTLSPSCNTETPQGWQQNEDNVWRVNG